MEIPDKTGPHLSSISNHEEFIGEGAQLSGISKWGQPEDFQKNEKLT